ncbi:hypothetical protein DL95DRAFT_396594 [Leptodontidium sp. 2 PMI_412]|nr:hypothetical protein DL95DRAFT_396594 [Leptodontidium sp. 2 PMI_412]
MGGKKKSYLIMFSALSFCFLYMALGRGWIELACSGAASVMKAFASEEDGATL